MGYNSSHKMDQIADSDIGNYYTQQLAVFYRMVESDRRMGTTHVSLYMALFYIWSQSRCQGPVAFTRQEVMPIAKINGRATYHKCMNELQEYGYIRYVPSCNPFLKSLVYFKT